MGRSVTYGKIFWKKSLDEIHAMQQWTKIRRNAEVESRRMEAIMDMKQEIEAFREEIQKVERRLVIKLGTMFCVSIFAIAIYTVVMLKAFK